VHVNVGDIPFWDAIFGVRMADKKVVHAASKHTCSNCNHTQDVSTDAIFTHREIDSSPMAMGVGGIAGSTEWNAYTCSNCGYTVLISRK
jgi:predicted nucleic-acid-binding Zn-ribbon protein